MKELKEKGIDIPREDSVWFGAGEFFGFSREQL